MREANPASLTRLIPSTAAQRRLERPSGDVWLDSAAVAKVAATTYRTFQAGKIANPCGAYLAAPKHGAKGRGGMRSDLIEGTLTLHQLRHMTLRQIAARYRMSRQGASEAKRYLLTWGLGGPYRLPGGRPRPGAGGQDRKG